MRARLALLLLAFPTLALADPPQSSLPAPPKDAEYLAWLHGQPDDVRLEINRFCTAHGLDYQSVCGGIGSLHIARPPAWDACAALMYTGRRRQGQRPRTRDEWFADLTKDQKHYTKQ